MGSGGEVDRGPETITVEGIYYEGLLHWTESGGETEFLRFAPDLYNAMEWVDGFNPVRARTTSGGALIFETDSPQVRISFRFDSEHENRGSTFGVSQNGGAIESTSVAGDQATFTLSIDSDFPGETVRYRVVLPNWSNPIMTELALDEGHELTDFEQPVRPVYVALGDSITHGQGQPSSYEGYAMQTSAALGTELYNLAVGGSKVSVPIAESLSDFPRLDLVTILVGYNDWMNEGKTVEEFETAYDALIGAVRDNDADVPIFSLTLLTAEDTISGASSIPIADFRAAIEDVVTARQEAGDSNLYLAPSETWTNDTTDLSDQVHLSSGGATKLAEALTAHISSTVDVGTGGSSGMGGSGSGGSGSGGDAGFTASWTFDAGVEGFEGWENGSLPADSTVLEYSANCEDGSATGCLKVTVPLTTIGQTGGARIQYNPTVDLTGKTITVRYKVLSGADGKVTAYAQDSAYKVSAVFRDFPASKPGAWSEAVFAVDTGTMVDPTDVLNIGSQILPGADAVTIETAVVLIDSITVD
jgi:lysophospholipase L1-like esterase